MPTSSTTVSDTDVLIMVPSYNDDLSLVEVVNRILALRRDWRILVIDDGSVIGSDPRRFDGRVLFFRLPENFGLGVCTHIAIDHALRYGYGAVVRVDADGQHSVDDISALLEVLNRGGADIVVGSRTNRNTGPGAGNLSRRLVKAYFAAIARIITGGRSPSDVNTGFFALNVRAMETLSRFQLERFPEPQMFILGCREGLTLNEVFIEQLERERGTSTLTVLQAARLFYRFNMFALNELIRGRSK